ncbi:cadherin domain-containing protein [Polaribacter aestuariivivens]|uniref:cadherin domain-containing protein n=1 Tax=Polaribacter aestuariivivens TaxID=2304626 RepID=UPI003F49A26C
MENIFKSKKWSYFIITTTLLLLSNCSKEEVNSPPVIENQEFSISETNLTSSIGTVVATDANDKSLEFSIVSQSVTKAMAINEITGELSVSTATAFDFEVNEKITAIIKVSDGSLDAQATITVNIIDEIDQAPTIADQTFSIDENSPNATVIGQVVASDPQNATLTYSITQQSISGALTISNSGSLSVADESVFDFETNQTFTASVQITNSVITDTAQITVNINDLVDQPPVIVDQSFFIKENSSMSSIIGSVTASDPQNLSLTYQITSQNTNNNSVNINANLGQLRVNAPEDFNFEQNEAIVLEVEASNGTLTSTANITINLTNVSPTTNGLIAHYQMNDNSGTAALDSSGNGNNADFILGSGRSNPDLVTGFDERQNHAFDLFPNSNNATFTHDTQDLSQTNSFTIASHFKFTTKEAAVLLNDTTDFRVVINPNSSNNNVDFIVNFPEGPNRTSKSFKKIISINEGEWHHFAITQSGEDWKLYINGVLANSTTSLGPFFKFEAGGSNVLIIGGRSLPFKGHLDNFTIYGRALSDSEIEVISKEEN